MALIACPYCQQETSDERTSCTHCGYYLRGPRPAASTPPEDPDQPQPIAPALANPAIGQAISSDVSTSTPETARATPPAEPDRYWVRAAESAGTPQRRPWVRLWARAVDYSLIGSLVNLTLALIAADVLHLSPLYQLPV